MLRGLVSQARSGTSPEQEAITAERDFFREKYAEQIDAMELMKGQLKESQRIIGKLRSQVLDLEVEKSQLLGQGGTPGKAPKQIESSGGSTNTSVTCLTYEDESLRSPGVDDSADCTRAVESENEVVDGTVVRENAATGQETNEMDTPNSPKDGEQSISDEESSEEEEDSGSDEDDEADVIRANAERMLMWANYQTTKRSTPNTSLIQESTDGLDVDDGSKSQASGLQRPDTPSKGAIVYSLPTSLGQSGVLDDDSTLGSSSRHRAEPSVGSWRSGTTSNSRMGKLFNNLRDMIDPESESESGESDDGSIDSNSR